MRARDHQCCRQSHGSSEASGIVGYIVQPDDTLWTIAKKFHTTIGTIISTNELADEQVKQGQRLLLVKEIAPC